MPRETRPPTMSNEAFHFLRGINAAIELCQECGGYSTMERILLSRYPGVKAIRDDGVSATHALRRDIVDGLSVMYRPMSGPSDCDWLVPTR
jgi:hypothetical protein